MMVRVEFATVDYGRTMKMKIAAEHIVKFLYDNASHGARYIKNFCRIIRISHNWSIDELEDRLEDAFKLIRIRRLKDDRDVQYFELVKRLFQTCRKTCDINVMRGLTTEYIVSRACARCRPLRGWCLSTGCTVAVEGKLISVSADGETKETVDVGAWCNVKACGFFIEIKTQPYSFRNIDAVYLTALRRELRKYEQIRYLICLFSLDVKGLMRRRVEQEGYEVHEETLFLDETNIFNTNLFDMVETLGGDKLNFVTDYLDRAARQWPEKIAVVDGVRQISYQDLWQEAKAVGECLVREGLPLGPVAIWLGKEISNIAASQGAALVGRAYAPLDIDMPKQRLGKIFTTLKPAVIITDKKHMAEVTEFAAVLESVPRIMAYEDMLEQGTDLAEVQDIVPLCEGRTEKDDAAIIFTSGSTGTPKGVVASHEMISAYTEWHVRALELDHDMVRAGQSPLYFVVGAFCDVYGTFAVGGTLHLLPASAFMFPKALMATLTRLQVNTIFWVPTVFRLVAEMKGLEAGELPPLRTVYFCGEVMPLPVLSAWRKAFPKAVFSNHYGTTEVICASWYKIGQDEELDCLPIGRACEGRSVIRLLKEDGQEASVGETGEVVVFGPVASRYLADEERTKTAFGYDGELGKRCFRTGDLARRDEKGVMIYVGRNDTQVKHMGYRIELGEIEAAAVSAEGLSACVCLYDVQKDDIVLFYVAEEQLTEKMLLSRLTEKLPRYMWPTRLERLEAMPQTAGGKIYRQALKERL